MRSDMWKQIILLFAFFFTASGQNATCSDQLAFEQISKQLQSVKNCMEETANQWSQYQNARVFYQLSLLTDIIQNSQDRELQKVLPSNCSAPVLPDNGGLLCANTDDHIYCKPMCNAGNDFDFIRVSRLYEECSHATQNKWTTQYVGGNSLASCSKSHVAVAGVSTAFFPVDQDCHKTKADKQLRSVHSKTFKSELEKAGITVTLNQLSLFCGKKK